MIALKQPLLLLAFAMAALIFSSEASLEESLLQSDTIVPESSDEHIFLEEQTARPKTGAFPKAASPIQAAHSKQRDDLAKLLQAHGSYGAALTHVNKLVSKLEAMQTSSTLVSDLSEMGWCKPCDWAAQKAREAEEAVKRAAEEAKRKVEEAARKVEEEAKKLAEAAKREAEKIANEAKRIAEAAANAAAKAAKDIVDKALEAAKWIAEAVKNAIGVIAKVIDIIKAGAGTVNCALGKGGQEIIKLVSNPANYMDAMGKKIEIEVPALLEIMTGSITKQMDNMKKILSGSAIDAGAIADDMLADVKKAAVVEPLVGCAVPMVEQTVEMLKKKGSQLMLMQSSQHNENDAVVQDAFQVITNWMIDVPWSGIIKPTISHFWQTGLNLMFKSVVSAVMGRAAFDAVESAIMKGFDQIKKTEEIAKALKKYNETPFGSKKHLQAYRDLKSYLLMEFNVADLMYFGVTGVKGVIVDPIVAWVGEQVPVLAQFIFSKPSMVLLVVLAFVIEEILSEPAPATQWGMEAIGAGISEPSKSGWEIVLTIGKMVVLKAFPWILTNIVNALFVLPELGAQNSGIALQAAIMPGVQAIGDGIERLIGDVKSFISFVPDDVFKAIAQMGTFVFDTVVGLVSPRMIDYIQTNRAIWKSIKMQEECGGHQVDCKYNLLQEFDQAHPMVHSAASIKKQMMAVLKKGFPKEHPAYQPVSYHFHPNFKTHLMQDQGVPQWMHQHLVPRKSNKVSSLKEMVEAHRVIHRAQNPHLSQHVAKRGSKQQVKSMMEDVNKIPGALSQISAVLANDSHQSEHSKELLETTTQLKKHLQEGRSSLVQVNFITEMVTFLTRRANDLKCLFVTGAAKANSFAADMTGKDFGQIVLTFLDNTAVFLGKLFNTVAGAIGSSLANIDGALANDDFLSARTFEKVLLDNLNRFREIEPAIGCIIPLIKDTLIKDVHKLQKVMDFMKDFFENNFLVKIAGNTVNYAMDKIGAGVGGFILGPSAFTSMQNSLALAFDKATAADEATIRNGLNKISKMKFNTQFLRDARTREVRLFSNELEGFATLNLKKYVPLAFEVVKIAIKNFIVQGIRMYQLPAMEVLSRYVSVLALPAAAFAVNEVAASGSVATEWAGAGYMGALYVGFGYSSVLFQNAIFGLSEWMATTILTVAFEAIALVGKPLSFIAFAPIDAAATAIMDLIKLQFDKILSLVPRGLMRVLENTARKMVDLLLNTVAPKLAQQRRLNLELANAVAWMNPDGLRWKKLHGRRNWKSGDWKIPIPAWGWGDGVLDNDNGGDNNGGNNNGGDNNGGNNNGGDNNGAENANGLEQCSRALFGIDFCSDW
jgi:hypothetical protein